MVARVLERTGAMVQARGAMYKVVAQSVLLYGSKSWVVTREMLKVLTGFHHLAARCITGMTEKRGAGGDWEYPSVEEAMEATRLHPHRGVHQEAAYDHSGEVGLPPHLCTVHVG